MRNDFQNRCSNPAFLRSFDSCDEGPGPRLLLWLQLALVLLVLSAGCQKDSEAIVSIALHPHNPNILYVATNDAVYKSRDGGGSWEKFPSFSARRVTTVAIDPQ